MTNDPQFFTGSGYATATQVSGSYFGMVRVTHYTPWGVRAHYGACGDECQRFMQRPQAVVPDNVRLASALRVLGLPDAATKDEAKARYRQLAREHHPDAGGDVEQMKRLNAAYEIACRG